ncbi:MAG: hypothetical protein AVDCRST_MAG85-2162, partial [uncultured Solirubrobacteraceae bacterium]
SPPSWRPAWTRSSRTWCGRLARPSSSRH